MDNVLTPEFIAENLQEIIEDFDYVDTEDIDDTTEYILTLWVLLEVDEQAEMDDDDTLIEGSMLYKLNDAIYESLINDDKPRLISIIKEQLLKDEKYEVLALMTHILE